MPGGKHIPYTQQERDFVRDNCTLPANQLWHYFQAKFKRPGVSKDALVALRKRNGWKTGRTGQFKKGNKPHPNAGCKGPNKTTFRPGNKPKNTRPVGSLSIRYHKGQGLTHVYIKLADSHWVLYHRFLWERKMGPIPEGMALIFLDGDQTRITIDNLILATRDELSVINKYRTYYGKDKALNPSLIALAKLKRAQSRAEKRRADADF